MDRLVPKDHREEVALFRHSLIGELASRALDLERGERLAHLRRLAAERVRPPNADNTRTYSVTTLERWLYAFKHGGLAALAPHPRADRGRGRDLGEDLRELLCDIRREHPSVSVRMILRTLQIDGRIGPEVTASTVCRLFRARGLLKQPPTARPGPRTRLRWQAERPNALWHGDVCHGPTVALAGRRVPIRIHALLDDASRYVPALRVRDNEREETMVDLFAGALTLHPRPDALYLDNGSTYRGSVLATACGRLGVGLLHARPHDPEARGKMERFWRTLREQALDHIGQVRSLDEVEQKLRTWLDRYYQVAPHAGLLGRAPAAVYADDDQKVFVTPEALREALLVRAQRRVRKDSTLGIDGKQYEIAHGYLAGQVVTVVRSLLDGGEPYAEVDGKRVGLKLVNAVDNSRRPRPPRREHDEAPTRPTGFDPGCTLQQEPAVQTTEKEVDLDDVFLSRRLWSARRALLQRNR